MRLVSQKTPERFLKSYYKDCYASYIIKKRILGPSVKTSQFTFLLQASTICEERLEKLLWQIDGFNS